MSCFLGAFFFIQIRKQDCQKCPQNGSKNIPLAGPLRLDTARQHSLSCSRSLQSNDVWKRNNVIVLKFVAIVGLIFAMGAAALCVLTARHRPTAILGVLGLAPGLGIGLIGLGTFYLAYWRVPLTEGTAWTFAGGLLLGLIGLNAALRRKEVSGTWQVVRPERIQPLQPFEVLLVLLITAGCLLVFVESLTQPTLGFDARAIWGMKAKVIGTYGQIYGEDFLDPDRLHAKQRYPLGLPAAVGFAYQLAGGFDERLGRVTYALLFLALGFFFFGSLRRYLGRTAALIGTCILSTLPAFTIFANGGAASGYSDVPLTYFYCVLVVSLFNWVRQRQFADLAVATVFGIFTLFTKNEGLALWGIALICLFLLFWIQTVATLGVVRGPLTRSSPALVLVSVAFAQSRRGFLSLAHSAKPCGRD